MPYLGKRRSSLRAKRFSPVSPPARSTVWSVSISRVREPRLPSSATADFPAAPGISVNEVVIHGIPGKRVIHAGDIVSVDVGAISTAITAITPPLSGRGDIPPGPGAYGRHQGNPFRGGIRAAKAGNRIGDIGAAVQRYVEVRGYSVVRQFVGHG